MRPEADDSNFVQFLGFLITLAAMLFLFLKQTWEDRRKKKDPEKYRIKEEQKQKAMHEIMSGLGTKHEKPKVHKNHKNAKAKPTVSKERPKVQANSPPTKYEYTYANTHARDAYSLEKSNKTSPVARLLKNRHALKHGIILSEVIGKPKAFF